MIVRRKASISFGSLKASLVAAGWDVSIHDALIGRREDAHGTWLLKVDNSGRMYVRRTRLTNASSGCTLQKEGHTFVLHSEQQHIQEIATELGEEDDVLKTLEMMVSLLLAADIEEICRSRHAPVSDL